eukprot:TRINITY_DN4083_c0_g1_i1.p1 TRINITY_DN4083_c0_g1~~TRINITY_DN4083_c0_g1_i1.p1  ORF type:complete len:276 (+),score=58.20 TRINITY_DN4083_c0_g1_i1:870-1697(+)
MDLMLAGRDPHKAVQMLYELSILRSSLKFPEACKELSEKASNKELKMFQSVKLVQVMWSLYELFHKDPLVFGVPLALPEKADLFYLALILPFAEYKYEQKGRAHEVYEYIINTGLKKTHTFARLAKHCYDNIARLHTVIKEPFNPVTTGFLIKDLGINKGPAILLSICKDYNTNVQEKDIEYKVKEELMSSVLNEYKNWIQMSDKMMIWNAESIKPHFDGKELAKMFEVSPGKIVKHLLDDQLSWQLVNPAKTKEDYAAYVEANKKVILSNIPSK